VSAQTPPVISDDFTANVTLNEDHNGHRVRMHGVLYEDYTNRRQRIDTQHSHEHPVHFSFFRFYSQHVEYEYQLENNQCIKRNLNATMRAAFNWVKTAKLEPRECHGEGKIGNLWDHITDHDVASLCDAKTNPNTTPFWMSFKRNHEGREVTFHTFTPGTPDPSKFNLPSPCH
jgi:hypothetical protein